MTKIVRTIRTDATIDRVFEYLADFTNATEWDPGTASSVPRDDSGAGVGQTYDLVVLWGNKKLPMVYRTVSLDPLASVTFVGEGSTTIATDTLDFAELPDGGTKVEYSAQITLKWPYRIAVPFLGSKFRALGDEAAASLTEVLAGLSEHP
ncbi:MAG: SRPBCC family protein [Actinomycetota bacterium]|jgi:carbon monoxide dehydrogenase subunit G|nr:SRPBCC family protein [Actinomycetota bacterium]